MIEKEYVTEINASKTAVWQALWDDKNYRDWTSVFHEGSFAESDWNEGSEILFLTPERDGMYSVIKELDEPDTMVFEHLGEIKKGEKQSSDEWKNATESYFLREEDGKTILTAKMDIEEKWMDFFEDTFPKALAKVKEIAESNE